jgi:hypothetical protein
MMPVRLLVHLSHPVSCRKKMVKKKDIPLKETTQIKLLILLLYT